ncbi:PREDICTED: coiled-coil domain-containing protein 39 [Dufourea novaeangliae]|uniref:coiled-coil domain-containing protein 39 n=1 Tax=Dufourea novaeangliae TaxID=178035 RepID=UPI0007678B83|nr:PREDICTED: coiled-coil domain-containing protein 39 [Dufourea novaeangliae]
MAININIDSILSALGWEDGFRIPVANAENKQLEEEIEKKMKLKENLTMKLEFTEERLKMMKNRQNNLKAEHDMNQKLLNEHSTQLETKNHHYRLCCSTESSLRQEARDFEKEWKKVSEMVANIKKELEKMTKKIETSKKAVKYDEKSLREWEDALNQNEDNNQLIEQYLKEDLKEYKELELRRQKLSKDLLLYREAIIKITNEGRETEIVLDRTSKLYDQALTDYQQMFNQWKESVIMLQQRNDDIQRVLKEIETFRDITQDKRNTLEESDKFLKEQNENNRQVEESIKKLEKNLCNVKEEQRKVKETLSIYENELIIQKNIMKESSNRVEQVRTDIKRKETEIQKKYTKIEKLNEQVGELTTKLQDIDGQQLNIKEKAKELEDMIEEQEKKKVGMIKEVNRLQNANLRVTNQLKKLEDESKIINMHYQNESKKFEYLDKLYTKDEKVLEEKKEGLYQVEFELQKSEMKLDRLRGHERDKSEAERKQMKIEELQGILNEKMKVSKLMQNQISSLEHDMRKMSNSLTSDNNELEYLRNKRQDLVLLMDAGEKQLKSAQNRYEEKQVEESLLRLKASQMEKMISNLGDSVYDLEKYRLELAAAIKERKAEIDVQKESLVIKKRVASSESSEIKNAISERKIRINQLQARYDNGIAMLGTNPDGTPVNTTHLKIQNAQERYLLQEQGDKLDETITKTELEIQAMENTLRLINVCNDKYKAATLTTDEKNKPELEEHRKLDEELYTAEESLKQKKMELQCLTDNLQKMKNEYTHVLKRIDEIQEQKENKNQYLVELSQYIHDQKEKILRADKSLRNVQKVIQQKFVATGDNTILIQEKEVELRELQEQNSIVLQDIAEFTIHHVEAEAYIKKLLAVKNIELPSIPLTIQSPISSHSYSTKNSVECVPKAINRGSIVSSSRESIRKVVNIIPEFETLTSQTSIKRITKYEQQSVKTVHSSTTKKTF